LFGYSGLRCDEHFSDVIRPDDFDAPLLEIGPPAGRIADDGYAPRDPSEREDRVRAMLQRAQGGHS
jgi:hypothetical protein